MSDGALIDDHVSVQQCKRAVDALLSHATKFEEKKSENQLLPGKEQNVWLVVNTKLMHPEKKIKPARIPIKYPIVDPRTSPVCLITKDPQREYKDLIAERGIKFISRVVDIKHLKGKWKPFEARRMLLKENGLFLADERVVPLLPALLGKKFFEAKKQPIPVCLTRKDLKGELERAISSTYFHQNQGTCTSVKIGTVSQKPAQVLANLQTALPEVVKHIKGGWDNVQSFFIKTNSSAALPIWQCDLSAEAGGRWEGLVAGASEDEDEEMGDAEEESASEGEGEMDVDKPAANAKAKGKKRAAEEAETEKEQPKKKAKAATPSSAPAKATPKAVAAEPKPAAAAGSAPASEPAKKKRRKSNADPASVAAPAPKAAEPTQEKNEKAESAGPSSDGVAEKEKKRKRRKSQAGAEPAPAAAATPTSPSSATNSAVQPASAAPKPTDAASTPAEGAPAQPAKKEKRKKARASAAAAAVAAQSSDATAPAPTPAKPSEFEPQTDVQASPADAGAAAPATPSVPKKKRRASAVDFFEDRDAAATTAATPAQATRPAIPPNTPADVLVGETPASGKGKKRSKKNAAGETPVTNAIAKLAVQPEPATPAAAVGEKAEAATPGEVETPSGKKQRKRKNKEPAVEGTPVSAPAKEKEPATPASAAEDTPAKKLKRKHKAALEAAAAAAPAPSLSVQEMKQKKSVSGLEKKKEKVVGAKPAAKSAKDAVVGKKKL
ncbi:ribosomal protein L1 [Pilatotrama ljubarskyi]|nr:ribosomal protein L1 [Pilatotrama ljubarskyi]